MNTLLASFKRFRLKVPIQSPMEILSPSNDKKLLKNFKSNVSLYRICMDIYVKVLLNGCKPTDHSLILSDEWLSGRAINC